MMRKMPERRQWFYILFSKKRSNTKRSSFIIIQLPIKKVLLKQWIISRNHSTLKLVRKNILNIFVKLRSLLIFLLLPVLTGNPLAVGLIMQKRLSKPELMHLNYIFISLQAITEYPGLTFV